MFELFGQYWPIKSVVLAVSESGLIASAILLSALICLGDWASLVWFFDQPYAAMKGLVVVAVCLLCFYFNDLYNLQAISRRAELLVRLAQSLGAASLILAMFYYMAPALMLGRGISISAAILIGVSLVVWRLVVDATGGFFRPVHRVLIAGTGPVGIRVAKEIIDHPELNFKVVGFLDEKGENIGKSLFNPRIIGGVAQVEEFVERESVHRVVLSLAERRGQTPIAQLLKVRMKGIPVENASSLYEQITGRIMVDSVSPSALIHSKGFRKNAVLLFAKRAIDIVVSAVGLVVLSPLLILIGLAIYVESGGPLFYLQDRVGAGGSVFRILKFRSMRPDAEQDGPRWAQREDDRVTRVGRMLRRFRLDEVPQFVNVLKGDMSLVGPRPERPQFVSMLEPAIPYYLLRHSVRPGITGWAQIKFQYTSSIEDAKTKLEYDLFYIKNISIAFDVVILLRTIQVVFLAHGAL